MNLAVVQEVRRDNATQIETSAQRRRIETSLWRIDFENLTQYVGPKKKKLTAVRLTPKFESVQRLLVLTREKTPGRFGHSPIVAWIDLNIGAAHESRALVVSAKRSVPRKTVEPKNLTTRHGRSALSKLEQLDTQPARVATHRNTMDIARCLDSTGPKQLITPL